MQNAARVGVREGGRDLAPHPEDERGGDSRAEAARQRGAVDVRHRDVGGADLEDWDDVRVRETKKGALLAREEGCGVSPPRELGAEELHGGDAVGDDVAAEPDFAHSTRADAAFEAVAADRRASVDDDRGGRGDAGGRG